MLKKSKSDGTIIEMTPAMHDLYVKARRAHDEYLTAFEPLSMEDQEFLCEAATASPAPKVRVGKFNRILQAKGQVT